MAEKTKKINYKLDENNTLIKWWCEPFHEDRPWIEIPDDLYPIPHYDKIINGELIHNSEAYWRDFNEANRRALIQNKIDSLKEQLAASDYKAIKHSEGLISDEDYEIIKQEREALRIQIRELQKQLDN